MQRTNHRVAVNGEAIRAIRIRSGHSLRSLSALTGLSFGHLGGLERGDSRATTDALLAIAEALDVPVSAISRSEIPVAS